MHYQVLLMLTSIVFMSCQEPIDTSSVSGGAEGKLGGGSFLLQSESQVSANKGERYFNLAVIGLDAKDSGGNQRADALVIVSLDRSLKKIHLFTLGRDARMPEDCWENQRRTFKHTIAELYSIAGRDVYLQCLQRVFNDYLPKMKTDMKQSDNSRSVIGNIKIHAFIETSFTEFDAIYSVLKSDVLTGDNISTAIEIYKKESKIFSGLMGALIDR